MSDQGWNNPPNDPNAGQGWNAPPPPSGGQQPPPPQPGGGQQPPPPQQPGQPGWGGQQPPPPQQGGQWGQQPPPPQQPGQPGWGGQQQPQSSGVDPKIAGILAYVPFGWLGGLVIYLVNKDPLSRFHGAQSILLSITIFAAYVAVGILGAILGFIFDFFGFIFFTLLWPLLGLGFLVLSIYLAVQGYNQQKTTLPVIGPIAENWAMK